MERILSSDTIQSAFRKFWGMVYWAQADQSERVQGRACLHTSCVQAKADYLFYVEHFYIFLLFLSRAGFLEESKL